MDGDSHQRKQHDPSSYPTVPGMGRRPVQQAPDGSRGPYGQPPLLPPRGEPPVRAQGQNSAVSAYTGYGYTEQQSYGASSFQGGSLHGGGLQYHPGFQTSPSRQQQTTQREQQQERQHQPSLPLPPPQPQSQQQQFSQYGSNMAYGLAQQSQTQTPYEVVPQYQPRQSAALEVLSSQLGVPQYFSPSEPTGTQVAGVLPQYLTPQVQPSSYSQSMVDRASTAQSFPVTMTEFNTTETSERLEQPEQGQEAASSDDAYSQYQQALQMAFDHIRAGRLVDASQSLLEISEWLVGNSRELGILRDDAELHSGRLKLWNEFNLCWLSLFQKQKDMTQGLLQSGERQSHPSMLAVDVLDKMGKELIRLCDKMEPHGLVDYQMGIWEEEILSVLGQCLDLLEGRNGAEQIRR
ncbi:37S ribosomal protein S9, mitochondrial [Paecilomyces lecythidis]